MIKLKVWRWLRSLFALNGFKGKNAAGEALHIGSNLDAHTDLHEELSGGLISPHGFITGDSKSLRSKQLFSLLLLIGALAIILLLMFSVLSKGGGSAGGQEARIKDASGDEVEKGKIKIETANKALDPEKMWRNHFEDKLQDSQNKVEKQLQVIEQSFNEKKKSWHRIRRENLEWQGSSLTLPG